MKRTNFILFAFMVVCGQIGAQDDLPYRKFQMFEKDTILYLDYNFTLRKDQYIGKTVGKILKDLELPVIYVSNFVTRLDPNDNNRSGIIVMDLVIHMNRDMNTERDDSKDYFIRIGLKYPLKHKDFLKALRTDERNNDKKGFFYWTPQLNELLKDYRLTFVTANDRLFEDRRKLKERNTSEDIEKINKIYEIERANWRSKIQAEKQEVNK